MSSLKYALTAAALGVSSTPAFATGFTVAELHAAAKVATETFKAEYGNQFHDAVYAIQSTKRTDGGRVKLWYQANGTTQSIEYFCHYHHAEAMDCHEL